MNYIKKYESLFGNKYYFTSDIDIHNTDIKVVRNKGIQINYLFSDRPIFIYPVYHKTDGHFKLSISRYSSYDVNFIYKVSDTLKLFKFDLYNITKILDKYPKTKEKLTNFFGVNSDVTERILKYNDSKLDIIRRFDEGELFDLMKQFNGVYIDDEHVFVFEDVYLNSKLVDGISVRFPNKGIETDVVFPDFVIDELLRYTNIANIKLNKEVKEWLKLNAPKPKEPITLYRGISIDTFPDYNDDIIGNPNKLGHLLNMRLGVRKIEDIHKGANIISKRGKESSWSYKPQIAKAFITGIGSEDINVLVKAIINPEDIIVDFTMFPSSIIDKFKYRYQNEVIVDTGKYSGTIVDVYLSKAIKHKMNIK